jgi:hypothetical protein
MRFVAGVASSLAGRTTIVTLKGGRPPTPTPKTRRGGEPVFFSAVASLFGGMPIQRTLTLKYRLLIYHRDGARSDT